MIRIVMDSAGDMPTEWEEKYEIHTIPINIHFGERTYFQGVDLTNEGFYELVHQSGTIPKTSQPTPHQFEVIYRKIAEPGDTIFSIHVTSKLSGTFESAEIAARQLKDEFHIIPVDSGGGSVSQGFMCREVREMDQRGFEIEAILNRLKDIREKTEIILTMNTLEYARMSGRVKAMQAALASMLNVKPIVTLKDGLLDVTDKVRTRRRSIETIVEKMHERIGSDLVNLAVVHAQDPQIGDRLFELVRDVFNYKEIIITELSIGIAANLGPGTVGIIACPALEG